MIIAKTPWLSESVDYIFGDGSFCCVSEVIKLFEIPVNSKIRFVVYNRPSNNRYKAFIIRDEWGPVLYVHGKRHHWLLDGLEKFLEQFKSDKIYYVECEIK